MKKNRLLLSDGVATLSCEAHLSGRKRRTHRFAPTACLLRSTGRFQTCPSCLLALLLCPLALSAQEITISGLAVNAGTVTFVVDWNRPATAGDSAWVFVDYNNAGTMTRLLLKESGHAVSAGKIYSPNSKGAWVVAATGSSSITVQLHACRDVACNASTLHGLCAYATNYPPTGTYTNTSVITFRGTPKYEVVLNNAANSPATVSGITSPYTVPAGSYVQSFSDATGAPGILIPAPFALNASAAVYCAGSSGVGFSLSGTQLGITYQLINKSTGGGVASLTGTGGAATFSGAHAAGTYYARSVPTAAYREVVSGAKVISVVNIPVAPTAPKHNGPKCAGTGVTFSTSVPSGATGLAWKGSASGSGTETSKTTATGAGNYAVQVRSYLTAGGTTCYSGYANSATATIVALPTVTSSTGGSRCVSGSVSLLATASSGAVIDWYDAPVGGLFLTTGNTYTASSFGIDRRNFYAQARTTPTGCVSASRTTVVATWNPNPSASIAPSATTVTQGSSVSLSVSAPGCNGCTYKWSTGSTNLTTSVSAPPYGRTSYYACTVTSSAGCTTTPTRASVTGNLAGAFASGTTWSYGGYTWSDHVTYEPSSSECTNVPVGSNGFNPSNYTAKQWRESSGRVYYSWACVVSIGKTKICPGLWSVPTRTRYSTLVNNVNADVLATAWGLDGYAANTGVSSVGAYGYYWTSDEFDVNWAYQLVVEPKMLEVGGTSKYWGQMVRCVM